MVWGVVGAGRNGGQAAPRTSHKPAQDSCMIYLSHCLPSSGIINIYLHNFFLWRSYTEHQCCWG
jgi:hypothetical protein